MVRQHLEKCGTNPEDCASFELIAYGPLFPQAPNMDEHKGPRDKVAALERVLAETLRGATYTVMNEVHSLKQLDDGLWEQVREAFACHFPKIRLQQPSLATGEG